VWKSQDGGTTFKPVFDKQPVQSIGAIAIDPKNPKTVWVGTGEAWTRNSVSVGDGIYKSTDGGETWTNMGLPSPSASPDPRRSEERQRLRLRPGKLWSDSDERGVYKTTDGGKTWTQVLKGAQPLDRLLDVTMDPKNPEDVLFAGLWDFRRKGWTFRSGGDGPTRRAAAALFKSTDGGKTWTNLSTKAAGPAAKPWGASRWPSRRRIRTSSTRFVESTEKRSTAPTTAARPGRRATAARTWSGGRSTSRAWSSIRRTRPLFQADLRLIVSDDGGKSFTRHRRRRARRLARRLDRSDEPQAHHRRRRRRPLVLVRRRQPLVEGRTTCRSRSSTT
jgi:hypothetical protein